MAVESTSIARAPQASRAFHERGRAAGSRPPGAPNLDQITTSNRRIISWSSCERMWQCQTQLSGRAPGEWNVATIRVTAPAGACTMSL